MSVEHLYSPVPSKIPVITDTTGGVRQLLLLGSASTVVEPLQWHLDQGETYDDAEFNGLPILKNLATTGPSYSATVTSPAPTGSTASGSCIDFGSTPLFPQTDDWELEFAYYVTDMDAQYAVFGAWNLSNRGLLVFTSPTLGWRMQWAGVVANTGAGDLPTVGWHQIRVTRVGNTVTLFVDGVQKIIRTDPFSMQSASLALAYGNSSTYNSSITNSSTGRICNLSITHSGHTTYWPLQEGAGRNIHWAKTDGTFGVVDAIKGSLVISWWANTDDAFTKDWSIDHGGTIGIDGAFIPGAYSGGVDCLGDPLEFSPGRLGNYKSRINHNPNAIAALSDVGAEAAGTFTSDRASEGTPNSMFARIDGTGKDRMLTYPEALTGGNLSTAKSYCPTSWSLRLTAFNIYGGLENPTQPGYIAAKAHIQRYRPDIYGLTEVSSSDNTQRVEEFGFSTGNPYLAESSGGSGVVRQCFLSRYPIEYSTSVPSGAGGNEFVRPPLWIELKIGPRRVAFCCVHCETLCSNAATCAVTTPYPINEYRRAAEWFRIQEFYETRKQTYPDLTLFMLGDGNDDPQKQQSVSVTDSETVGASPWGGFNAGAGLPSSFDYANYPDRQLTAMGLTRVALTNIDGSRSTLWTGSPNSAISLESQIDFQGYDSEVFSLDGSEIADSEATQTGGIKKYGSALATTDSRDASDHKMTVADFSLI